jgi:hypothetical protein
MSLVLTIGGVTALLRRNVFLPVEKLRDYVESSEENLKSPPHLPHDLDVIAEHCFKLKKRAAAENGKSETTDLVG